MEMKETTTRIGIEGGIGGTGMMDAKGSKKEVDRWKWRDEKKNSQRYTEWRAYKPFTNHKQHENGFVSLTLKSQIQWCEYDVCGVRSLVLWMRDQCVCICCLYVSVCELSWIAWSSEQLYGIFFMLFQVYNVWLRIAQSSHWSFRIWTLRLRCLYILIHIRATQLNLAYKTTESIWSVSF